MKKAQSKKNPAYLLKKLKNRRTEGFSFRTYREELPAEIYNMLGEGAINVPKRNIYYTDQIVYVYFDSVTTIINDIVRMPFLEQWRGNVGNEVSDIIIKEALERGSEIHNGIDNYCKGFVIVYNSEKAPTLSPADIREIEKVNNATVFVVKRERSMQSIANFVNLLKHLNPDILWTEKNVSSYEHGFAGTLDALWEFKQDIICTANGKGKNSAFKIPAGIYVIDYKTGKQSNNIYAGTQLSAYAHCCEERFGLVDKISGALIIHINDTKTGIPGISVSLISRDELNQYFERFLHIKALFDFNRKDYSPRPYVVNEMLFREDIKLTRKLKRRQTTKVSDKAISLIEELLTTKNKKDEKAKNRQRKNPGVSKRIQGH